MGSASLQHRFAPHLTTYARPQSPTRGYTTSLLSAVEQALLAATRDAVVVVNLDMLVAFSNARAESLFGYSLADLIATPFHRLIPDHFRIPYEKFWRRHLADSHAAESENEFELLGKHKDGAIFPMEIRATWMRHERGLFILHVIRDLRERNALLEEFRQAQKMEIMGRLAGGVSHDFNNVLTVMNGYSEMLANDANLDVQVRTMAKEIRNAGERGAHITGQLLTFCRRHAVEPQVLDLNKCVSRMESMLRHLIGERITLAIEPCLNLGHAIADPGQIDQVLLNLVINARDAMPQAGRITVATSNDEGQRLNDQYAFDRYVQLSVADTGCGMDKHTQARMFEPLFTTKGPGKGTGLGLSIVQQVMTQSDGRIDVTSEPGHGTTFKLSFPRVDGPSAEATAERQKAIPRGNETILLVEDDEAVRGVMRNTLREYGYTILEASNTAAAMKLIRENSVPLVVMDVVLPHTTGPRLALRIRREQPNIKVLYISSYTDETDLSELDTSDPLLLKPFTPSLLAIRIRELLDARQ